VARQQNLDLRYHNLVTRKTLLSWMLRFSFARLFATSARPRVPAQRVSISRKPSTGTGKSFDSATPPQSSETTARGTDIGRSAQKKLPASVEKAFRRSATYSAAPASATSRAWLPPEVAPNQRSLNVAIVGEPNVGKSTLVNRLLRRKVSAVSPKQNTTRDRVLGVLTEGNIQLVFYDTPGFVPASGVRDPRVCCAAGV
jgi:hypothetical protein